MLRYWTGEKNFFKSLLEKFVWTPLLAIFLGGLRL